MAFRICFRVGNAEDTHTHCMLKTHTQTHTQAFANIQTFIKANSQRHTHTCMLFCGSSALELWVEGASQHVPYDPRKNTPGEAHRQPQTARIRDTHTAHCQIQLQMHRHKKVPSGIAQQRQKIANTCPANDRFIYTYITEVVIILSYII